jgi:Phage integrase, N-terminal SAM-like domain
VFNLERDAMTATAESQPQPGLLDEVRRVLRLHHYSIHTERSYLQWIVRFVRFHHMASRQDLMPAEPRIEAFLTHLAVTQDVAAATQNLAMVEITLSFKDRRDRIIFEETAYPVYVSSLSNPHGSKSLAPGQQIKFAFKSPACPKAWQPGQVDVRMTKVVASNS